MKEFIKSLIAKTAAWYQRVRTRWSCADKVAVALASLLVAEVIIGFMDLLGRISPAGGNQIPYQFDVRPWNAYIRHFRV